ncbi:MAG: PilZ domain-containing protein [Treponema sp.]|nr:PilZ domain-containing protein [Treponema sp.]
MFVVLFITIISILLVIKLLVTFQIPIQFFMTGQDKGFKLNEITLLWKLAKEAEIEEPLSLYVSVPTLNMAISKIILNSKENGTEGNADTQNFISKLYEYRTKIDLEHDNKKGLESTKYLEKGQRLRIILKGKGVFASEILSVGHELIIRLPLQKNVRTFEGNIWVGNEISVYLWRKGDAGYVFDTRVTNAGVFQGQNVIYLAHTNQLERAQKRKSVRSACEIYAQLYFIENEEPDFEAIEVSAGYKCLLEDISEDGAMIRIGGKGRQNIKIKIQFEIDSRIIVMFGIVRAVEYNSQTNQSRLHFECLHIDKEMKNTILSFIYRDLSEDKKDALQALAEVEEEEEGDKNQIHNGDYSSPEESSEEIEKSLDQGLVEEPSGEEDVEDSESEGNNPSPDLLGF